MPKTAGRLESITVKLGDRVTRGQRIAKIEDQELLEQVKQAEAAFQVASATIRQREADLELAKTNVERSRNLFQRQLLPQQTLDDSEAKYQSAQAALDLARAQNTQSQARLDELRAINCRTPSSRHRSTDSLRDERPIPARSCPRTRRSLTSSISRPCGSW